MKKLTKSFLIVLLGLLMSVNVMADVQTGKTEPDYKTDYYMIVESKDGGIDIYAQPDFDSTRLNDEQIPNGIALHIEGEVEDTENNRTWGYTEFHGMYGYVSLDECRPAVSRKEAIDSELYIAGRDHVNYNADYDVKAYAEEGSQKLYQGPGTKYGEVPGVRDIENGETLHITQDAELVDGSYWGVTTVDRKEGWMDLEKTEEWRKEHPETTDANTDALARVWKCNIRGTPCRRIEYNTYSDRSSSNRNACPNRSSDSNGNTCPNRNACTSRNCSSNRNASTNRNTCHEGQ